MKKNLKHDLKVHRSELLLHNTLTVFIRTPVRMQIETQIDADKMTNMLWGISDNSLTAWPWNRCSITIWTLSDYFSEKGKQYKQRTTISVRRMIPVVLRNHFLHLTIGMLTSMLHNMVIPMWSERTYFDPLVFLAKFWTVKLKPVIIQSVNILTRSRFSEFKAGRHRILLTMNRWIRTPESTE